MKYVKNIMNNLRSALTTNPAMIIYSVLIAIIAWFIISITVYPTTPKTLSNIPVEVDITGTSAEENGLSVISYETKKVTVTIQGNRSSIGSLSADDLVASAVVENVTSAGEKYLKINVISKKSDVKFDVTSVSPSTMAVMFDKIDTREKDSAILLGFSSRGIVHCIDNLADFNINTACFNRLSHSCLDNNSNTGRIPRQNKYQYCDH